ncbi:thiamine phosphate synthase [Candidatus Pelagibacter communis]|uniref:thiamine phosphate synthase n=1 Tax=Pelagibacter ubique TaxID=198252 RepID=UPI00094C2C97|nr:thiamine phosphate synthase [Candidatus Pelagibacter ubique]
MHKSLWEKYYFINSLDTNVIKKQNEKTTIIYRNYSQKIINENKIITFNNNCKKYGINFIFANNIKLAIKLKLMGVYIPSFNNSFEHLSFSLKKNFIILGSAHNNKEIKVKIKQGVQKVFVSSIFKKNVNYLGLNKFKFLTSQHKIKFIALGGISQSNIKKLGLTNCIGFAGISFFQKKRPLKKRPFII